VRWAGSGKVFIEASAVADYLAITGASELDRTTFDIVPDLKRTDPSQFYGLENKRL
jgi:hypothetical protein